MLHPHLHCLVTGGGWDGEHWQAIRNGYLLPARVVMPVDRGKFLAALHSAVDAGQLTLPAGVTLAQVRMLLNRLGRTKWHVQLMTRYAHGHGVATYLARYLRSGPLKSSRLVAWDEETVTFRYADNQDRDAQGRGTRKVMTLSTEDFLQRWLLPVPPPGFAVVRRYGRYAPGKCATLTQCRQALGQTPVELPQPLNWQTYCARQGPQHPECCPVCGQRLIRTAPVAPQRHHPSGAHAPPEISPGARAGWPEAA